MEQNRGKRFGGKRALPVGLVVNGSSVKREQIRAIYTFFDFASSC